MRGDVPRLYLLTFLLASYTNSKSYASKDMDSGSSGIEMDLGKDDSVSVHESYRPRHKFKTGTGQFSKRFVGNKNEMQAGKGLECAVMYKNNEPIGILQPYEESYRFLPVNGEPTLVDLNPVPAKRKTIMDVLYPSEAEDDYYDDSVGFSDERYPSIFAKFKIDSRLDRSLSPKMDVSKRSVKKRELFNGQVSLNDQVEEELRNILGDIGLVDDYPNQDSKRKAEDENLELGTNKIEIAKESREKRFDFGNTLMPVEKTSTDVSKPELEEIKSIIEPLSSLNENINQEESVSKDSMIDNKEESVVAEVDSREKRGEKESMKSKVAVANDDMPVLACNTEKVEENNNLDDYGKRVEREIRDKIHKLKEEVKKEIENLKKADHDEMDNTERKKKQTLNTLAEESNSDIDPNASGHENDDVNIRRKRSITYPDTAFNVEEIVPVESEEILTVDNQNSKSKGHQSRSLKQVSVDYASEEEDEYDNEPTRKKRQIAMEDENDYSYDESESGFIDENRIADSEGESGDMVESFASNEKTGCSCDKNSGSCKCANGQSKTGDSNSKEHAASPGKNPAHHHCSCSKNDNNCKCGSSLIDDMPLELSGYDDDVEFEIVPKPKAEKRSVPSSFHKVHIARQSPLADDFGNYRNSFDSPFKSVVKPVKRETHGTFENGQYFIDLQPSIFKLSPAEKAPDSITDERMPTKRHLVAVRQQRKMSPHSRFRRRVQRDENNREPRQLIDMSEEDIFGALPQSYEGELARYKRVKRNRKK